MIIVFWGNHNLRIFAIYIHYFPIYWSTVDPLKRTISRVSLINYKTSKDGPLTSAHLQSVGGGGATLRIKKKGRQGSTVL